MDSLTGNIMIDTSDSVCASSRDDTFIRQEYARTDAWGLEAQINLHVCNSDTIRDAKAIRRFVRKLCERIEMKRFGKCVVVNFGEDEKVAGYSMTQLIETSLISGHFANQTNRTFLNIFSCKYFNPWEAAEFSKEFFGAHDYTLTFNLRN